MRKKRNIGREEELTCRGTIRKTVIPGFNISSAKVIAMKDITQDHERTISIELVTLSPSESQKLFPMVEVINLEEIKNII